MNYMTSLLKSKAFSVIKSFLMTDARSDNCPTIGPSMNSFVATSSLQQEDVEEEAEVATEEVANDRAGDDGLTDDGKSQQ